MIKLSQKTISSDVETRLRVDDSDHGISAPCESHIIIIFDHVNSV